LKKIRVVVANRPRLMRELVLATISDQPDIEIVGEAADEAAILDSIEQLQPDFLVVSLDETDERPAICDFVLERFPGLKVLAIAPDRNSTIFYWASFDIHSNRVQASEEGVLKAIRGTAPVLGSQQ
jgi:DNA-binding NarL/FixJ family response regulator